MASIVLFLVLFALFVAFRATTPEEHQQLLRTGQTWMGLFIEGAVRNRLDCKPLRDALRARTRWAFVAPGLAALGVTIFALMLYRGEWPGNPQTLVAWGANFAPRTTNGEWWRVLTAMFLHAGMLQLLVTIVVLVDIGVAIERLVGRVAVAVVYIAAGVVASVTSLFESQISVISGPSGALCGLYGLFLAWLCWGWLRPSPVSISLAALKRFAPGATIFLVYTAATGGFNRAAALAFATGFLAGLILLIGTRDKRPSALRTATTAAIAAAVVVACAVTLRGIIDVRPEIERVVALEAETSDVYKAALDRFQKRFIGLEALAKTIDSTIVPPLEAADARLHTLGRVAREQQELLTDAQKYAQLRQEGWRLRSAALRQMNERTPAKMPNRQVETRYRANTSMFGKAEELDRSSLEVFKRIRAAGSSEKFGPR